MSRYCLLGFGVLLLACQGVVLGDVPVFSGPQIGERLPSFKAKGVFGDLAGKEFDLITQADGKPVALVFFHGGGRPAAALMNTVMKYAGSKSKDGLESGVIFLTDDPTATEKCTQTTKTNCQHGGQLGQAVELRHRGRSKDSPSLVEELRQST